MEKTEIIAKAIVVFKSAVLALKSGTNTSSWPSLTLIKDFRLLVAGQTSFKKM